MIVSTRRAYLFALFRRLAILTVTVGLGLSHSAGKVQAQFWGMGWGGLTYNPHTSLYLEQRSLQAGSAAFAARSSVTNNFYRGNPNAYINHVRDNSFIDRYDPATRRTMEESVARRPSELGSPMLNRRCR